MFPQRGPTGREVAAFRRTWRSWRRKVGVGCQHTHSLPCGRVQLIGPGNANKVGDARPSQAGSQMNGTSIEQLPSEAERGINRTLTAPSLSDRLYGILKLVFFDAPSCVLFLSSPTQGRRKTQQERQPEKGAGDRRDGREKTESSAGTRRVKDQQQGAEGPGEEAVFHGQKYLLLRAHEPPLYFTVPSNKRQQQLKLQILIFKRLPVSWTSVKMCFCY